MGNDLEVLVAVGPSTDGTRELVAEMAARDPRIHVVDNPERITPAGLNAAIRASRGRVILRMDGHAVPEPNYVSSCLRALEESGAWNVGGRILKVGRTRAARAASAATSSPFGIGGGQRFHTLVTAADVDTVWPGCWPRWVFERIGLFDPEMVQNQDDELNQRLLDAGGRIRFDPSIGATYLSRGSWRGLLRQYFRYGCSRSAASRSGRTSSGRATSLPAPSSRSSSGASSSSVLPARARRPCTVAVAWRGSRPRSSRLRRAPANDRRSRRDAGVRLHPCRSTARDVGRARAPREAVRRRSGRCPAARSIPPPPVRRSTRL
jgi:GT2 family glycosyltransferase